MRGPFPWGRSARSRRRHVGLAEPERPVAYPRCEETAIVGALQLCEADGRLSGCVLCLNDSVSQREALAVGSRYKMLGQARHRHSPGISDNIVYSDLKLSLSPTAEVDRPVPHHSAQKQRMGLSLVGGTHIQVVTYCAEQRFWCSQFREGPATRQNFRHLTPPLVGMNQSTCTRIRTQNGASHFALGSVM